MVGSPWVSETRCLSLCPSSEGWVLCLEGLRWEAAGASGRQDSFFQLPRLVGEEISDPLSASCVSPGPQCQEPGSRKFQELAGFQIGDRGGKKEDKQ